LVSEPRRRPTHAPCHLGGMRAPGEGSVRGPLQEGDGSGGRGGDPRELGLLGGRRLTSGSGFVPVRTRAGRVARYVAREEAATPSLALNCHPSPPGRAGRGIAARPHRPSPDVLELSFVLDGELPRLRVPLAGPPGRGERLWEHTCFEAFVAVPGS